MHSDRKTQSTTDSTIPLTDPLVAGKKGTTTTKQDSPKSNQLIEKVFKAIHIVFPASRTKTGFFKNPYNQSTK
jgi:hypothetical protein